MTATLVFEVIRVKKLSKEAPNPMFPSNIYLQPTNQIADDNSAYQAHCHDNLYIIRRTNFGTDSDS